jgi:hypothetical protein
VPEQKYAALEVSVEKADELLGLIFVKVCATSPNVEDYDGDIADEYSMERAFYEFLENQPEEPFDFEHKEKISGKIVAGWWFPEEHLGRVAFKPDDPKVVQIALDGDIVGTSYAAMVEREPLSL